MKYRFTISNRHNTYSEEYDENTIDLEWLENYSEDQKRDIVCDYNGLTKTNGNHIIFGVVESLLQNDKVMPWMESKGCCYKWEKLN